MRNSRRYHSFPLDTAARRSDRIELFRLTTNGALQQCPRGGIGFTGAGRRETRIACVRLILQHGRPSMADDSPGFIIAVVDDDQRILESLEMLLESAGHAVRLFASAAALLENGSLAEIDCLISDIGLPVMDGFELLRLVHAAQPGLPVILITGHPEMLSRLPPPDAGHYQLFKKPFNGQELLTAVSDALRNSNPRRR